MSFTVQEIAKFAAGLPADAEVILVAQRGSRRNVMGTEFRSPDPNWPRAVWEGLSIAVGAIPDPDESPPVPPSSTDGGPPTDARL